MQCPSGYVIQVRDGVQFKQKSAKLDVTCSRQNGGYYWAEPQTSTSNPESFFKMDMTCQESSQAAAIILAFVAVVVIILVVLLIFIVLRNKTDLLGGSNKNKDKKNKFNYNVDPKQRDELGGNLLMPAMIDQSNLSGPVGPSSAETGPLFQMDNNGRADFELSNKTFNKNATQRDSGLNQDMRDMSSGRGSALFDSPSSNLGNLALQPLNVETGDYLEFPKALEFDFVSPKIKTLYNKTVNYNKLEAVYDSKSYDDLFQEFESIPKRDIKKPTAVASANEGKSRYKDVEPYDFNRVKLPKNEFINASNIIGFNNRRYIAAMGPKKDTVHDFWTMVWHNNVSIIVMLTNFFESGIEKCAQYWPHRQDQYVIDI